MIPVRPDPIGIFDIFIGFLVLNTVTGVPPTFSQLHAGFLMFKGGISLLRGIPPIPPLFVLGAVADIISAVILYTGQPPVFSGYKEIFAAVLFFKGLISILSLLS